MCSLALIATCFVGCKENNGNNPVPDEDLPNGFYVAVADANLVKANAMDQGINEVDQTARTGMYEKYIVLEANKEYEFVNKKGANADRYGVPALEYGDSLIVTDNHEIAGYKGSLAANTKVKVKETALYHVVLDFNEDGSLEDVGGAQCIIVPVEWGVRGAMNGWGWTAGEKSEANGTITWTWNNQEIAANGEFKFAHNDCWKIELDIAKLVKANTNLGDGCVPGGDNIVVAELGLYTITLTYKASEDPATNESFSFEVKKTGDVEVKDYSKCELELVGDAVADQDDAVADASSWSWGNTLSLGLPTLSGDVYTWTRSNVSLLAAGGFKVRTINAEDQGDIKAFNFGIDGENATVEQDGTYTIVASVNAKTGDTQLQIVSGAAKGITVTGVVPAEWEHCYLWAWDDNDNNVFAAWPGQELEIVGGKVSYTFLPTIESINVIFSDGNGTQTNDITGITADQEIDIVSNLK